MARASLDKSVEWTRQRLRVDGGLLATVSLALVGVPAMLLQVVLANAPKVPAEFLGQPLDQIDPGPTEWIALVALFLALLLGSLTLATMLLSPGGTVRSALSHSGRRLWVLIAGQLMIGLVVLLVLVLVALIIVVLGAAGSAGQAVGGVIVIVFLVALLILTARLSFLVPSAVDAGGPVTVVKRAFARGRGLNLALLVLVIVTFVLTLIVTFAAQAIVGIPVAIAAGPTAGAMAGGAAAGLAYALTSLVTLVLTVGLYRQTGSGVDEGDVRGG